MKSLKFPISAFLLYSLFISPLHSQEKISWKRNSSEIETELHLFHSIHSLNLPTSETLQRGDLEFEISHRFIPRISEGSKEFWGLDGPVNIRLALSYAVTDDLLVALGRSNVDDNYDFRVKMKLFSLKNELFPLLIAARAGSAWNTDPVGRGAGDNMNFQYYGQVIVNTMIAGKLGVGIVPSFLYNSHIYCVDKETTFTLGTYVEYFLSSTWGFTVEYNPTVSGFRNKYDAAAFGVELNTGGHFFKLFFTNSTLLNPSQYLAGADIPFKFDNLRFGFNITRLLSL